MNDHLKLLIAEENGVVAHKVTNTDTNEVVDFGVCTHLKYLLNSITEKYGELKFEMFQNTLSCTPKKPSLFHAICNPLGSHVDLEEF